MRHAARVESLTEVGTSATPSLRGAGLTKASATRPCIEAVGPACSDRIPGAYPGPQFGVSGTRRLSGVETLPLIGTIIKPSVGLTPQQTAEMVDQLAKGKPIIGVLNYFAGNGMNTFTH